MDKMEILLRAIDSVGQDAKENERKATEEKDHDSVLVFTAGWKTVRPVYNF